MRDGTQTITELGGCNGSVGRRDQHPLASNSPRGRVYSASPALTTSTNSGSCCSASTPSLWHARTHDNGSHSASRQQHAAGARWGHGLALLRRDCCAKTPPAREGKKVVLAPRALCTVKRGFASHTNNRQAALAATTRHTAPTAEHPGIPHGSSASTQPCKHAHAVNKWRGGARCAQRRLITPHASWEQHTAYPVRQQQTRSEHCVARRHTRDNAANGTGATAARARAHMANAGGGNDGDGRRA